MSRSLRAAKARGEADKTTAALTFAKRVLDTKGEATESDLDTVRSAGFSDGEIAEIIAHVALNAFTNYFNIATDIDIDFPKVSYSAHRNATAGVHDGSRGLRLG